MPARPGPDTTRFLYRAEAHRRPGPGLPGPGRGPSPGRSDRPADNAHGQDRRDGPAAPLHGPRHRPAL